MVRMHLAVCVAPAFLAVLLTGCGPDPHSSRGDENALSFKYMSGHGFVAVGGYPLTTSLAPGTKEAIRTDPPLPMSITVHSSNESVATFEILPDTISDDGKDTAVIWVRAHDEGDAELRVEDESGMLIDRVSLNVAAPSRAIIVSDDVDETTSIVLHEGGDASLYTRCVDEEGEEVLASFGWTWRIEDPTVAELWLTNVTNPEAGAQVVEDTDSTATVLGRAAGMTTLTATIAGIDEAAPVTVE